MISPIVETSATGEQIERLVDRIVAALDGVQRSHAIIACLSLTLLLMKETVTPDQIQEGVKGASQWICAFLQDEPTQTTKAS